MILKRSIYAIASQGTGLGMGICLRQRAREAILAARLRAGEPLPLVPPLVPMERYQSRKIVSRVSRAFSSMPKSFPYPEPLRNRFKFLG